MLYLYFILLIMTGYSIYSFSVKKPLFTFTDQKYQYQDNAGFTKQNCKLDKTCWIKPDNINGAIPIENPKLLRNYVFVFNKFKTVELPNQYLKQSYGNILI